MLCIEVIVRISLSLLINIGKDSSSLPLSTQSEVPGAIFLLPKWNATWEAYAGSSIGAHRENMWSAQLPPQLIVDSEEQNIFVSAKVLQ